MSGDICKVRPPLECDGDPRNGEAYRMSRMRSQLKVPQLCCG